MSTNADTGNSFPFGWFMRIRLTDDGSPGTLDMVNFDLPLRSQSDVPCNGVGDLPISQGSPKQASSLQRVS